MEKPIEIIKQLIGENASEKEWTWLENAVANPPKLPLAFVACPRFVGKKIIEYNHLFINELEVNGWTLDRLVRVYLLLVLESESQIDQIEALFDTAEINESIALFSALPLFNQPEKWLHRATDAVRSNIGEVFNSLAFSNPYPATYFSELAWNQLVLKCIFNDKPIHLIQSIDERANQALADTLSDFAHERWAAGRSVPAQVWRLVIHFMNDQLLGDMEKLFQSGNRTDKIAAALVCTQSGIGGVLLQKYPLTDSEIECINQGWKYLESHQS